MTSTLKQIVRDLWLSAYNRFKGKGKEAREKEGFIVVRLWNSGSECDAANPCALLPEDGFKAFWDALGVTEEAEERLTPEWIKGNWIPVSQDFPVISRLIHVQLDSTVIERMHISELLREVSVGKQKCKESLGLVVFNELEKAGNLALERGKGLSLSPFG